MTMSLREQLLAAGLGNKKQARQAEHQQRQRQHQQAKNKPAREEQQRREEEARAKAQAAKVARDQELNKRRQENAEHRARWAQVKQIIEQHRLPKPDSDEYFNFIDRKKVRRIPATPELRAQLASGTIAIARCEGRYDFVPAQIAERIREREPRGVVELNQASEQPVDENDPYRDFVVPDDLMW